ncbi:MAG: Sua5/YciO/YrdC/YwlC family protein, partial [Euzebyales bacterium]|nr:Sua5/YciO/YrdC/YwlC family protein [Euzebyales bacterium]
MPEIMPAHDRDVAVRRAVAVLGEGNLVVLPTDTLYAVVADAFATAATRRLFSARGGGSAPLTVLIRNPRQVIGLARDVPETAERLMATYWPGPLTIVLAAQPDMPWDLGDTDDTVA